MPLQNYTSKGPQRPFQPPDRPLDRLSMGFDQYSIPSSLNRRGPYEDNDKAYYNFLKIVDPGNPLLKERSCLKVPLNWSSVIIAKVDPDELYVVAISKLRPARMTYWFRADDNDPRGILAEATLVTPKRDGGMSGVDKFEVSHSAAAVILGTVAELTTTYSSEIQELLADRAAANLPATPEAPDLV